MLEWLKNDDTPKLKIELNITLQNQNFSNNLTLKRDFKSHSTVYTQCAGEQYDPQYFQLK